MAPDHPSVSASPGNLLEMQSLRPHPRLLKPETLGVGPRNMCFNMFFHDSDAHSLLDKSLQFLHYAFVNSFYNVRHYIWLL